MSSKNNNINKNHEQKRKTIRTIGTVVLITGIIFTAVGFISFFSSFGSFEPPKYFWCSFIGLPLLGIGGGLLKMGYMGSVARYTAEEIAPVTKDTFNYMADGTSEGVRKISKSISEGIKEASEGNDDKTLVKCFKCNEVNDSDAKFCKNCGAALEKTKMCSNCGELNDPDAKFCDNCGEKFN
ncbi:zinc ribbon domain-containing protein [Caldisalinibacter kiritimatiensis]|uniref:DZANK-type domain-containing protein n=1 Tax=Caldisalinibacter kiritimatiensis TaxID=1304284 RepID=R1AS64_9FIRM|nr:zinc ribbon domain-containing protein [Caldisalinibacter kiritimatiensis]EOC99972.1 hypothetical protein L21TH_1983 [Caldisalinibacter kiritimatiensis]